MSSVAHTNLNAMLLEGLRVTRPVWEQGEKSIDSQTAMRMISVAQQSLLNCDLKKGDRIAIHGAPSPESLSSMIAALLCGLVVVPVDSTLNESRKQRMLELAGVSTMLDFDKANSFEHALPVISNSDALHANDDLYSCDETDVNDACYVFFTSGSTGDPKPVLGRRSGLAHFIAWERDLLNLMPSDRASLVTRFSFDVVLRDALLPVVSGCSSVLPVGTTPMDATSMGVWIVEQQISVLHTVPSLAHAMLSSTKKTRLGYALKHTLFAGEPLGHVIVSRWRAQYPNSKVHNLYGPTETTLAKFHSVVPDPAPLGIQNCGIGLPGTTLNIISESKKILPVNELGEVAIATGYASLGYLQPCGSIKKISNEGNEILGYMTGDLGFVDESGKLHLRGRKDDQIKINGVRLELSGITALIEQHKDITKAVVLAKTDQNGFKSLVAWYCPSAGLSLSSGEIRKFLADLLPQSGIPGQLIECHSFPVTANGKIDKSKLVKPSCPAEYAAPDSELEELVISAFEQQLGLSGISAAADFFELGGDSLAALSISLMLSKELNVQIDPTVFLDAPTPRSLASALDERETITEIPIGPAPISRSFHLTPQQQRYFRTYCAAGNRNWCNMVALIELPNEVSEFEVSSAIKDISLHHDSLRLAFEIDDSGAILQFINPDSVFNLDVKDLTEEIEKELPTILTKLQILESEKLINVFSEYALFRACLLLLPGGKRTLLWNVHHLISDGTSQGIFSNLLSQWLVDSQEIKKSLSKILSFKDLAHHTTPQPSRPISSYFINLLSKPTLYQHRYLPIVHNVADVQRCFAFDAALSGSTVKNVRAQAKRMKCTPYIILLCGYFSMLNKLTNQSDITIVTPLAGREHPQSRELIANLINLVSLRIADFNAIDTKALVSHVVTLVKGAAKHQDDQFDQVIDALKLPVPQDRNALTGFSFNYMPQGKNGVQSEHSYSDRGYKLKFDLLFLVRDFKNTINVEIRYCAGLFNQAEIQAVFDQFETNLKDTSNEF